MAARYLDEFEVGQVFETEPVTLSEEDIIGFADGTIRRCFTPTRRLRRTAFMVG